MDRRTFLVTSAAALAAGPVLAGVGTKYTPGLVDKELAAGKTVFIDFYTDWCSTCRSQERTINAFLDANPAYEANVSFIAVDWDVHSGSDLAKRLNIPRRSTLVVLRGDEELGRIVAGTSKSKIKALMDTALTAATA
ncbi:MAG: thioredoxin family protein [Boseongicola sp.]|nr:thioredoxin family protein [Boseongicola sp.]MDD9978914.1 thioredoxin family protein [Boseongicola sp.]